MEEFDERFTLLGYDSTSIVYNLGDLAIIQFWIFIELIFLGLLKLLSKVERYECIAKRKEKFVAKYQKIKLSVLWNWPIRFIFEAYLELSIATILKFKAMTYSYSTAADVFDTVLGIFYVILVVTGPAFYFIFFGINSDKLRKNQKTFVDKYETLFDSIKVDQFWNVNYNAFFMLRRFIFVMSCVYWNGSFFILQILYALVESMVFISYLINFRPKKNK